MDAIIANMAKTAAFDAAHYTWVYVSVENLRRYNLRDLQDKLLQHGDYAAPLRTEDVRQPFNNMAIVMKMGSVAGEDTFFVVTVDGKDGVVYEIVLHNAQKAPHNKVFTLHFKPPVELVQKIMEVSENVAHPDTPAERQSLIEYEPHVPYDLRKSLGDYFLPYLRIALCYVPAASDGLLAGEVISFRKPRDLGNNAKRKRKGKAPLYEWSTVQLERKIPELPAAPKGGTHASPRLHQRRGHWVTSKLGKRFWRSESVVGKPENGMIFHDYKDGGAHA